MMYKEIEMLLKNNEEFSIKKTYGHPFVDFSIKNVGKTFEASIGKTATFIPSLDALYFKFISNNYEQFSAQNITKEDLYGRIARMWASLVREWHSYYMLLEFGYGYGLDSDVIIRNDDLDTTKGIDVYLLNKENKNESIKLDILQSTKRADEYRKIKDTRRVKDLDIPGKKYKIRLGRDNSKTTKIVNGWFLLQESYALSILKYFMKVIKQGG